MSYWWKSFVFGTNGGDTLIGSAFKDRIFGFGSDDTIEAGAGNDTVFGGRGDDVINGGAGNDVLYGGRGFDTAIYEGGIGDYEITMPTRGPWWSFGHWSPTTVKATGDVADTGTDKLWGIEALYFEGDDYTLYLNGQNNDVLAGDDALAAGENEVLLVDTADLLANDREFDGDAMTVTAVGTTATAGTSVSLVGGQVTYDPGTAFDALAAGETATDSFSYTVDDGKGGTDTATVTVTITGANDAPVIAALAAVTIDENTVDVAAAISATDVDSANLSFSLSGTDAGLFQIDSMTGALSFVAAPDFEAPGDADGDNFYDVTVSVSDGIDSDSADIAVTVADVAELPPLDARMNEFHYDNASADAGEFVEIRLAAGTDPSRLSVEVYNGSSGALYNSFALPGTPAGSDGTYDYYVIDTPGLQNGSPDGIALIGDGAVVEFLSYEGTLTAADGTAAGQSSTDVGVVEVGSTPIGQSLQRNGDGTWRGPEAETRGLDNDFVPVPEIVISEIMQNPAAVSDGNGEYFEVYNAGSGDVDLNGWTISDNDTDSHVIGNGGPLVVAAGGYLVFGINADMATNGGVSVDYAYSGIALANGADEVVLTSPDFGEIDRVEYDGGPAFPDPNGASMELVDLAADNNDGANWTTAVAGFGDGDLGTPGAANGAAPTAFAGRINEFHYDNDGSDVGEFVEIRVEAGSDVSLASITLYNGNGGASYATYDFPASAASSDGTYDYYVIETPGIQNGNDGIALSNDGALVEFLSYEGSFTAVGGPADGVAASDVVVSEATTTPIGQSLQRNDDGTWRAPEAETRGESNEADVTPPGELVLISQIQGAGSMSPFDGLGVTVNAVVTYIGAGGFFLQEEDADADADAATSEGIFVFAGGASLPSLGDRVSVSGTVDEFFGLTQITSVTDITVELGNQPMPTAAEILLDPAVSQDFEAVEGMRITLDSGVAGERITVTQNFNLDRFGEITVSAGNQVQGTQLYDAQTEAAQVAAVNDGNVNNRLLIDDGVSASNPTEFAYIPVEAAFDNGNGYLDSGDTFTSDGPTLRLGAEIDGPTTGVMSYGFGAYRMLVDGQLNVDQSTNTGARVATPEDVGGTLQVGAFNVLNYFTTLGDRGASSAGDLQRQTDATVESMLTSGVDVFALQEIENNGFGAGSAMQTLTDALNLSTEDGANFSVVDPTGGGGGVLGTDAITTGIVYDTTKMTLMASDFLVFDEPSAAATFELAEVLHPFVASGDQISDFQRSRPAVAATFMDNDSGEVFTVVSVHFKSKGDSNLQDLAEAAQSYLDGGGTGFTRADVDALTSDPNYDAGDGQGFWNGVRTDAADELQDWLGNTYQGGVSSYVVLGDFNAYAQEDPVQSLRDAPDMTDLIDTYIGQENAYSFVFDGQRGTLDQAIASDEFAMNVTGLTEWHINADEPDLLNYSSQFKDPAFYNEDVFASSDHDPLILGLDFSDATVIG